MKFSAQEEYGVRCLIAVARRNDGATIPEVAREEGLSVPHVAKLLAILRRLGYVNSMRGQNGGYTLARPADRVTLGRVLADLGGRLYDEGYCVRHSGLGTVCVHKGKCALGPVWTRVQKAVDDVLDNVTLQEVIEHAEVLETNSQPCLPETS
jgi:Rrf2 family protein